MTRLNELKGQLMAAQAVYDKALGDCELARSNAQSAADPFERMVADDRLTKAQSALNEAELQLAWADKV